MSIFTKTRKQTIVVDKETNFEVQRFAEHNNNGEPIEVWWNGDEWFRVNFKTKQTKRAIVERLKKIFGSQYEVGMNNNLIYVLNR